MHQAVSVHTEFGELPGLLNEPAEGHGLIVFAHGSGSSRLSPRNRFVSGVLEHAGFGTLLFDLLTPEEDLTYANRFDIALLASRLIEACKWSRERLRDPRLPLGLFGASTGAAAALVAAANPEIAVSAVVSRGGRPDLAGAALAAVVAPTLLIVGALDSEVIELNRQAMKRMPTSTITRLEIVPGATHLFEEPGTLERAADLARDWFVGYATR